VREIRYLAEQWNFAADQRIRAGVSMEKQWNLCGVRKRSIVVTLRNWQEIIESPLTE
jgi:hypothetical protein